VLVSCARLWWLQLSGARVEDSSVLNIRMSEQRLLSCFGLFYFRGVLSLFLCVSLKVIAIPLSELSIL
jgi:hypothetical protein